MVRAGVLHIWRGRVLQRPGQVEHNLRVTS